MKKIYTLLFCLVLSFTIKAQYVTIPDANFAAILQSKFPTCMNGNKLDTTCSNVMNASFLGGLTNVSDITGVRYFDNLETLFCDGNTITFLPKLPPNLFVLDCRNNQIASVVSGFPTQLNQLFMFGNQLTSVPTLPPNLEYLEIGGNKITTLSATWPASLTGLDCTTGQLTSIANLPPNLEALLCGQNQLTSLPALPASLKKLGCNQNKLTALPALPVGITDIACAYNQLTSLPTLPDSLIYLWCHNNSLTSLPALPDSLRQLECYFNQLTAIPPVPGSLRSLNCYYNQLTSLPAIAHTDIRTLQCMNNLLASLPALPVGLRELDCYNNKLTSLPVLPANLFRLKCYTNLLDSLPVLIHTQLTRLECGENNLKVLPALPDTLTYLDASENQLIKIVSFPPSLATFKVNDNKSLACIPPLAYFSGGASAFDIRRTAITCFPAPIPHTGIIAAIDNMPICGPCGVPVHHMGKVSTNAATVVWTAQDCIYSYHVQYRKKGTSAWTTLTASTNAIFKILKGLTPATTYQVRMATTCADTTTTVWSATQTFTTDKVCAAPVGITITNVKKDRVTVSWNTIPGVYSYQVRYRVQGTSTWTKKVAKAPLTHKVITGLTANTIYEYQLITVCDTTGAQASGWTSIGTFTTLLRVGEDGDAVSLSIYPNPASEQVTVNSELNTGDELVVTDMLGRTIISQSMAQGANRTAINVSGLANGVYLLTLKTESGITTRKFVKE